MSHTAAELHEAVLQTLTNSGRLEKINAEIREAVFKIITQGRENFPQNELTRENFVINELIREYLQFNGYNNSLSVFLRETSQPKEPMNREFLAQTVNVNPHHEIPILYSMTNIGENEDSPEEYIPTKDPSNYNFGKQSLKTCLFHQETNENNISNDDSSDGFFEIKST